MNTLQSEISQAKRWWNNTLSINEQNALANAHLENFEVSALTGAKNQYCTKDYIDKIILKLYKANG